MTFEEIKALDEQYVMPAYSRFPVAVDHGKGATVWDVAGKEYIDFTAGIGVCSLGYDYQPWVDAVSAQAAKLAHISNLYYAEPYAKLAQKLCTRAGMSNVMFANSGAEGNEAINDQIEKQINGQTKTAMLQNSIAAEFNRIHKWEKQYNSYLKTVSGYASSLKACTHLYNDGVRIFLTLGKLGNAIRNNPQGIIASMSMNNLYIETATELVSVFTLLNDAVAKGGKENMLTGAERSKTLWALNDKLSVFSRKLHLLYLSIRYYTLNDVWNNVTAGMLDRNNGEAARMAMSRWRRAAVLAR